MATLRRARDRLTPEQVGLPAGLRRRTPGLRREELALLAGVSVDYVVRLEQGRSSRPSTQVLTALARALRLETGERDELFHLAGAEPPSPGRAEMHVRPSVLRLIDRFADLPTIVLSAKGDVLAWNSMASALHGDWSALRPERRNLLRLRFLPDASDPPRSRVVSPDGADENTATQSVRAFAPRQRAIRTTLNWPSWWPSCALAVGSSRGSGTSVERPAGAATARLSCTRSSVR